MTLVCQGGGPYLKKIMFCSVEYIVMVHQNGLNLTSLQQVALGQKIHLEINRVMTLVCQGALSKKIMFCSVEYIFVVHQNGLNLTSPVG